ncbi:MAG: type II toxin-antitoxin system VapC family toxin [Dehalococcoidia bacterium]|nr:type II toxin-antitoxin system VapC family toxin [Dehalococcoidia bacterium]
MILYLDTSSLVKLYLREEGSEVVRRLRDQAETLTTSWLAYTEARSVFARKHREGNLTRNELRQLVHELEGDWAGYLALDVSSKLLLDAGNLTEKHVLRALDAIHLASALSLRDGPRFPGRSLTFSAADGRLLAAARAEGLDCAAD